MESSCCPPTNVSPIYLKYENAADGECSEAQLKTKGHPWRREIKYAYEVIAELIQPFMKQWFSQPQLTLSLSMDGMTEPLLATSILWLILYRP
jgi:hypothetical protein